MPNDHLRMLIQLLRPTTPDLARRWVAALLMVPEDERTGVVEAVEARIAAEFGADAKAGEMAERWLHVSGPEVQKDGYTERVERTYEVQGEGEDAARAREVG